LSSVGAGRRPPHGGRFLPPDPRVEEPYRLTPQLALRIGILGMVVLGAFAVLFLRLWALQILSGDQLRAAAQENQLRTVRVPAARGPIFDRNGQVLVGNVIGNSVQIWPADLPKTWPELRSQLRHLSRVLDVPVRQMLVQIEKRKGDPLTPVTVKRAIRDDEVAYLYENAAAFSGVTVSRSYLRDYPYKALGAHVLGHVGEASPEHLERRKELRLGDEVGLVGVEAAFDAFLRGVPGKARLRVDSRGRPRSRLIPTVQPRPGHAIRLTIDVNIQRAAQRALDYGIASALENEDWYANGGAIVALDPRNGEVLALASNPTFKPSLFVGRPDPRKLCPLLQERCAEPQNHPGLNRALAGRYPPGSTFKPVVALAAMQEGLLSPYSPLLCSGLYTFRGENGVDYQYRNWTSAYYESMALPRALETSCDTYFYQLGMSFYDQPAERGAALQDWSRRFGFGRPTGIEVGPEDTGLLPTPSWRRRTFEHEVDKAWRPGDSINLSIGQGDLVVTPLQMARFYALLANGGKLVKPHLVQTVEQPTAQSEAPAVLRRFMPAPAKSVGVDPAGVAIVHEGLVRAANGSEGTSTGVFGSFPELIAGKTGTAEKYSSEHGRGIDQSWWCGYGPAERPSIVVCAVIENGGHGGTAAAPAARRVFEAYFGKTGGGVTPQETD
jgi:penicillin-binding protein 2